MHRVRPGIALLVLGGLLASLSVNHPAQAAVEPLSQSGCPAGTAVAGPNLVTNGDFAAGTTAFESDLLDVGPDRQPLDPNGGFSIHTGPVSYGGGFVIGKPFPGNTFLDAPASNTYLYANPNPEQVNSPPFKPFTGLVWRQRVDGLQPATVYNFYGYFDNLLIRPDGDPQIELRVGAPGQPTATVGSPIAIPVNPDRWVPLQIAFRTGPADTSAVLEIRHLNEVTNGGDVGITALGLRQCSGALGVAKYARFPVRNENGSFTVTFEIVAENMSRPGGDTLTAIQLVDDLSKTFTGSGGFSVVSLTSPSLSTNPAYNGTSVTQLLTGTDQLAPGQRATLTLVVNARPGSGAAGRGPYFNSVSGSARANALLVQDESAPSLLPDPNGNGSPKDEDEDRPTPVLLGIPNVNMPLITK